MEQTPQIASSQENTRSGPKRIKYNLEDCRKKAKEGDFSFLHAQARVGDFMVLRTHEESPSTGILVWMVRITNRTNKKTEEVGVWYEGELVPMAELCKKLGMVLTTLFSRVTRWQERVPLEKWLQAPHRTNQITLERRLLREEESTVQSVDVGKKTKSKAKHQRFTRAQQLEMAAQHDYSFLYPGAHINGYEVVKISQSNSGAVVSVAKLGDAEGSQFQCTWFEDNLRSFADIADRVGMNEQTIASRATKWSPVGDQLPLEAVVLRPLNTKTSLVERGKEPPRIFETRPAAAPQASDFVAAAAAANIPAVPSLATIPAPAPAPLANRQEHFLPESEIENSLIHYMEVKTGRKVAEIKLSVSRQDGVTARVITS